MKNILKNTPKLLLAAILVCGTTSCDDFLDLKPQDTRTEDNFYRTEADAREALTGIYDVLQWNTVTGYHPTPMLLDIASDDAYAGGGSRTDAPNIIEVDMHNILTTNLEIHGLWRKHFFGISRANLLLSKMENIEASDAVKARLTAEAKFLRAHFYLDLVRFYENVPLVLEPLVEASEFSQPQAAPKAVYDQIAKDLEEAIPDLPETTLAASQGRATKWAAKALLAKAFLFYNGVYGQNLETGSITVDAPRTLQHLQDIITQSGHGLLPNYADIFTPAGEFSVESVWEIGYSDENPWFDWGFVHGGEGNIQPQMQGPRLQDPAAEQYQSGWSFAPATQSLYNAFEENDPRREATLLLETELEGSIDRGYQHTGYFSQKYTTANAYKPTAGQQELNWGNNYRAIRYADVLLMAAELAVKSGGGTPQDWLDMVRDRVDLPSKPATLDNIYQERRVELALEGQRYWDLLRRGINVADQAISSTQIGPFYTGDPIDYNIDFKPATNGFFPIPQSEIDLSGRLLQQNSGY
ncbi:RagB/SusD family nutrient uptake outer membrane protein [Pontibacter rugosus]|uniref:RagB/SusD family nutrient uptake outer membrane protein n=1 Tax=Pontibacter rugosus TaxID=1745966 RepID=A0ABW3SQI9_9BACT